MRGRGTVDEATLYERALQSTRDIVAGVEADQLGNPTPCTEWDARALLNHIIGGLHFFAEAARTGKAPAVDDGVDLVGDDPLGAYEEGQQAALVAWPDDPDRMTELPFGTLPASVARQIHALDAFVHGWDLAKATGQETDIDRDVAEALLDRSAIPETMRGTIFANEQPCDAERPPADRLAAYLGRTV